jgi:predicted nucleic acid-binding protein
MDGLNRSKGVTIGFADLLIAAAALEVGYGVVTANMRHFEMIPSLAVYQY